MVAFTYRMPAGIPGDINRAEVATVEAQVITPSGTTGAPTAYGVPVVIDATSGQARTLTAGDTAAYGLLARPFPTQDYYGINEPLGTGGAPPTQGTCDVLVRGYMTVLLSGSTGAVKAGKVYVWTAGPSGTHITGGFESTNPGASGIALNAYFMGPADASGNVEVAFNI